MSYTTTIFNKEQTLTADAMNNIIAGIDESQKFDWEGKTIAFWGDSVTAAGNGDAEYPFEGTPTWSKMVGKYFRCAKTYTRGIGGQRFSWGSGTKNGGSVSFIYQETGNLNNRNDSYDLDTYTGAIPEGCVAVRGCGCSYSRIAAMFPEAIREEIDCVFMIYHNDAAGSTAGESVSWIANDTTDPEWASSEHYAKYGGDYNITTTAGGIVSAVMKMQAILPNAVIVLGTPVAGRGAVGALNQSQDTAENYNVELKDLILKVGSQFGIPVIDVFGTSGINGLNRNKYIYDGIHPNKYGNTMLARAVIGGLKNITPLVYTNRKPAIIEGSIIVSNSTINQPHQGIEGFEAGKTYSYTITPQYTGNITVYYGYPKYTNSNGWAYTSSPSTGINGKCTAGVAITGTFTIPTDLNDAGDSIEVVIIRTNTTDAVTVDYKFIKQD